MRIRVDLPAPFSPTMAWSSPASTSKSTPSSASVAPKCLLAPLTLAAAWLTVLPPRPRPGGASPRHVCDLHLFVGDLSALDDHVVVEGHGAVTHRHVVMSLGGPFAAALGVRPGGEQKIAGKAAGAGVMSHGVGAVERDRVPAALRIEPPAEMRDRVAVHVMGMRLVAVEPIAHQPGVESTIDPANEAIADVEAHFVLHIAAIGQHDDVARRKYQGTNGGAFDGEGVQVAGTRAIEAAGRCRIAL